MVDSNPSRRRFLKLGATSAVVVVVAGVGAYLGLQQPQPPAPVTTPKSSPVAPIPAVTPSPTQTPATAPSPIAPRPVLPSPATVQLSPPPSVEKAKEEGSVMAYSGFWVAIMDAIKNGFERKYPGIKMEYVRGFAEVIQRTLTEARAGKAINDVQLQAYSSALPLLDEGIITPYVSAEDAAYPSEVRDPKGLFLASLGGVIGIAYRKDFSPEKHPKNYFDLLQPHFRDGRISVVDPNALHYYYLTLKTRIIGEARWRPWLEAMEKQKPKLATSAATAITFLTAGEADVAIGTYVSAVIDLMKEGKLIDYLKTPGLSTTSSMGPLINKFAPHPNAARLLRDYVVSEEGSKVIASLPAYVSMRPGVPSTIPGIDVKDLILHPPHTLKDLMDIRAEVNKMLGRPV